MAVDASHPYCFEEDGLLWVSEALAERTQRAQTELDRFHRRAALALAIGRAAGAVIGIVAGVLIASAVPASSSGILVGVAFGAILGFLFGGAVGGLIERRVDAPERDTGFPPRMPVPLEVAAAAPPGSSAEQIMRWSQAVNAYHADAQKVPDGVGPGTTNKYARTAQAMRELSLRLAQERQVYMKVATELGFPPQPAPPGLHEVDS